MREREETEGREVKKYYLTMEIEINPVGINDASLFDWIQALLTDGDILLEDLTLIDVEEADL